MDFIIAYKNYILIGFGILGVIILLLKTVKPNREKEIKDYNSIEDNEEESEPEEEEVETYDSTLDCPNCNEEVEGTIPVGTSKEEFYKTKKCDYCGCNLIKKQSEET